MSFPHMGWEHKGLVTLSCHRDQEWTHSMHILHYDNGCSVNVLVQNSLEWGRHKAGKIARKQCPSKRCHLHVQQPAQATEGSQCHRRAWPPLEENPGSKQSRCLLKKKVAASVERNQTLYDNINSAPIPRLARCVRDYVMQIDRAQLI